jgi:hypothetical protein
MRRLAMCGLLAAADPTERRIAGIRDRHWILLDT